MHFCKSKYQGSHDPLPFALMRAVHFASSAVSVLQDFSHSLSIAGLGLWARRGVSVSGGRRRRV